MTENSTQRKLTAILSADVKGYSKLMGDDDEATVNTITTYRDIISESIQNHQGRVVDSPGDNILAEFNSALMAVKSAIAIQRRLAIENAKVPDTRRMDFRIGINIGDILHKGDRIYGDGVNIAARIESLAEPGGICVSRGVYDQVKKNVSQRFDYLGEHAVKNITEPVRIYKILISSDSGGEVNQKPRPKAKKNKIFYSAIIAIFAVVSILAGLRFLERFKEVESTSINKSDSYLSDKPSIAVLPFNNLSGDPEQEYFSDGITNDIITDLSKFRELYVIASNTVFTYKGKAVNVKDVSHDLGVQYLLEGSVQRIGDRLRINSQLVDANTGHHLWAERYNKNYKDLFKLQTEIVQTIVSKLAIEIEETERERVIRKGTNNLKAYDFLLRGQEYLYKNTREANRKARIMFEKAIEIDSRYATAYAELARTHINDFLYGWSVFPNKSIQLAKDIAEESLSIDHSNARAHGALGSIYVRQAQYDLALSELQQAIELNPNDSQSLYVFGSVLLYSGRKDEAIHWKERVMSLDPNSELAIYMTLSQAYYLNDRYDDAIKLLKKGIEKRPDFVGNYIVLAAAYAQAGFIEEAKRAADKVLQLQPFFQTASYGTIFQKPEDRSKLIDGLRKAGLK